MRGAAQNPFLTTTPTRRRFGDNQIATLQTKEGRGRLADELAKQSTHPAQKKALRGLMVYIVYALAKKPITDHPTENLKPAKVARKSNGHLTWHDEQITQYRAAGEIRLSIGVDADLPA